jgi:hypothetical protein
MPEIKLVLIDLKDGINNSINASDAYYPSLIHVAPADIVLLRKATGLLVKYFRRPWAYVGGQKPYEANLELLDEIDDMKGLKDVEMERLRELLVERKTPLEVELVLDGRRQRRLP